MGLRSADTRASNARRASEEAAQNRFEGRARRASQEEMINAPKHDRLTRGDTAAELGVQIGEYLTKLKVQWKNCFREDTRDLKDQEVDTIAAIIRMYRGVQDDEDRDEDRLFPDRGAFEVAMSIVILLNMVVLGLEVESEGKATNDRSMVWIILEAVFCFAFIIEIGLKLRYHGCKWLYADWPNPLNFLIVVCMLLDCALFHPLGIYSFLRLASLIRVMGLMGLRKTLSRLHVMEDLRLVLEGLWASIITIFWVVVLCLIFLYMCSVFVTEQIGHNDDFINYRKISGGWDHEEYFGSIGRSMFTLLQVMTLDCWSSKIARHVINIQWEMSFFFVIFVVLCSYGLLNIVISVIVEHMLQASAKNDRKAKVRLEHAQKQELESIKEVFLLSDRDGSGEVDLKEFLEAAKNPEVQWRMKQLGLPLTGAAKLFAVIDGDGSRTLSIQEFINGCKKLKGIAQSKDLLVIQAQADILSAKMEGLARSLEDSERMMGILDAITQRTDRRFPHAVEGARRKFALYAGSMKPMVPVDKSKKEQPLSVGNAPVLPQFPSLLC